MYRVTIYNGSDLTIIHEPSPDPREPHLSSCKLVEGVSGDIDSLTFEILPNNPGYDLLSSRTTMIVVLDTRTDVAEFTGRVLTVTPAMDEGGLISKKVVCESRLGYLCDSVQPYVPETTYYGDDTRTGVEEFLDLLLANHNAQVEEYKRIYRGTVTFTTSTGDVTKGLNYQTTWEAIKDKLLSLGGEIQLYAGPDGLLYLDYVEELGTDGSQTIEIAKNLRSITQEIDPTSVITRLIPLGATLEPDEDNPDEEVDTNERTTIASVNNGVIYLDDEDAQRVYGIVVGTVYWDDVTEPENLLKKGQEWLDNQALVDKVTLSAYDLSLIGLEADSIERYNYYRTTINEIGLDKYLRVVKKVTNICDPSDITYEMGQQSSSMASVLADASSNAASAAADAAAMINSNLSKTVTMLIASNAIITNLTVKIAQIEEAYIDKATVGELVAETIEAEMGSFGYLRADDLEAELARFGYLTADSAEILQLYSDLANIVSLLAGEASVGTLQTIHLTADNSVIDEAVIIDALMDNAVISTLLAGTIYTDYIKIANNEDENAWFDGATLQFTDDNGVIRLQFGKDASGDYGMYAWDADGNLYWNEKGLTYDGLTGNGAIIVNDAIADNAAISGYKLDIESVTSCLNEYGGITVDMSMVTINDSTLDAWYATITQSVAETQASAITGSDTEYYSSTSPYGLYGGNWTTATPDWEDGCYIWIRTTFTYGDGSVTTTEPVCITGNSGKAGTPGENGTGIASVTDYYRLTAKIDPETEYCPDADSYYSGRSYTSYGITYTVQDDGSIVADGTATSISTFYITYSGSPSVYLPAGDCVITGCPEGGNDSTYRVYITYKKDGGTTNEAAYEYGSGITLTNAAESQLVTFCIQIKYGMTVSGMVFKPSIVSFDADEITDWTTDAQTPTEDMPYLWNYQVITYTDGSVYESDKRLIGVYGRSGTDGKGISRTETYYAAGSSPTECPDGPDTETWSLERPDVGATEYLWMAYLILYDDGTSDWIGICCLTDDALRDQVTVLQSELQVVQDQIYAKVWLTDISEAVENLDISEHRNYALLSGGYTEDSSPDCWWTTRTSYSERYAITMCSGYVRFTCAAAGDGQWYLGLSGDFDKSVTHTITVKFRKSSTKAVILHSYATYSDTGSLMQKLYLAEDDSFDANEWVTKSVQFTPRNNDIYTYAGVGICFSSDDMSVGDTLDVAWVMVEQGTEAHDWQRAPEDYATTNDITVLQDQYAQLEILYNSITLEVGNLTTALDEYTQSFDTQIAAIKLSTSEITETVQQTSQTLEACVTYYEPQYALSDSTETFTGSDLDWDPDPPAWAEGKYMWMRTKYTSVDGTVYYGNPVCIAGATGAAGANGTSFNVKGTAYCRYEEDVMDDVYKEGEYLKLYYDVNLEELITEGETGDAYIVNGYLCVYAYTENDIPYYSCAGKIQGEDGVSVSSFVGMYGLSESAKEEPESWSLDKLYAGLNEYLWMRWRIVYSDGNIEYTEPVLITDDSLREVVSTMSEQVAEITTEVGSITETVKDIQSTISGSDESLLSRIGQLEVTAGDITGTVEKLQQDVTDNYEYLYDYISTVQQTADSWSVTIEGMESTLAGYGARNYALLSGGYKAADSTDGWWATGSSTYEARYPVTMCDGYTHIECATVGLGYWYLSLSDDFEPGETYTITVRIRKSTATATGIYYRRTSSTSNSSIGTIPASAITAGEWVTYSMSWEPSDSYEYAYIGFYLASGNMAVGDYLDVAWVMVEKGTEAHDWQRAPEDYASTSTVYGQIALATAEIQGNIISYINMSADVISLTSNRLIVDSDNFKLTANGTATLYSAVLSGTITTESGLYKTVLDSGKLSMYYNSVKYGAFAAGYWVDSPSDRGIAMDIENSATYIAFAQDSNGDGTYTAAYVINWGLNPSGYTERHVFYNDIRVVGSIYPGGTGNTTYYLGYSTDGGLYTNGILAVKGILLAGNTYISGHTSAQLQVNGDAAINGKVYSGYIYPTLIYPGGYSNNTAYYLNSWSYNSSTTGIYCSGAFATNSQVIIGNTVYDSLSSYMLHVKGGAYFNGTIKVSGTTYTSDLNEKTDIVEIDERYENLFMGLKPVNYMFKNLSDEDNHDRIHCGLVAQWTEETAIACGLDSVSFAAICRDDLEIPTVDGRTERYGMAYTELIGLTIHMLQKSIARIETLEEELSTANEEIALLRSQISTQQAAA